MITLREARIISGLTQKEIADKVGVHKNTYMRWEQGVGSIPANHFVSLCKIFGVGVDDIFLPKHTTNVANETQHKRKDNK